MFALKFDLHQFSICECESVKMKTIKNEKTKNVSIKEEKAYNVLLNRIR